jgi:hypothetical protein
LCVKVVRKNNREVEIIFYGDGSGILNASTMQFTIALVMLCNMCIFMVKSCAEVKFRYFTFTMGPVSIKPKVGLNFNYDDNIFDFSVPVADVVSRCFCGIKLDGDFNKVHFSFFPGAQYVFFIQNSYLNYNDKKFLSSAALSLGNMDIRYKYEYSEDTHPTTYSKRFVKENYIGNSISLMYSFYRFNIGVSYNTSFTDRGIFWESNKAEDVALSLYLKFLYEKNIGLNIKYAKNEWSISHGRDCDSRNFSVGINGRLTYKIFSDIQFGYGIYDYKEIKDWSGFVFLGTLTWNLTAEDKVVLSLQQAASESFYSRENYYVRRGVSCSLQKALGSRFVIKPYVRYAFDNYPVPPYPRRMDGIVEAGVEIYLKVKSLHAVGVKYSVVSRNSAIKEYNFVASNISFFSALY